MLIKYYAYGSGSSYNCTHWFDKLQADYFSLLRKPKEDFEINTNERENTKRLLNLVTELQSKIDFLERKQ